MKPYTEFLNRPCKINTEDTERGGDDSQHNKWSQPHSAQSYNNQADEVIQVFVRTNISLLTARDCTVSAFFRRTKLHEKGILCPEILKSSEGLRAPYGFDLRSGVAYGCLQLLREVENDSTLHFSTCWVEFDDLSMAVYEHADQLPLFFISANDIKSVQPAAIEPEGHVFEVQASQLVTSQLVTRTFRFLATDTASRTYWIEFIDRKRRKIPVVLPTVVMSAYTRFATSRAMATRRSSVTSSSPKRSPKQRRSSVTGPSMSRAASAKEALHDYDTDGTERASSEKVPEVHVRRSSIMLTSPWSGSPLKTNLEYGNPIVAAEEFTARLLRTQSISFLSGGPKSSRRYSLTGPNFSQSLRGFYDSGHSEAEENDDTNSPMDHNDTGGDSGNNSPNNSSKNDSTADNGDAYSLSLFRSCIMSTQMVAFMEAQLATESFDPILTYLRSCDKPLSPMLPSYLPFPVVATDYSPLEMFYPSVYAGESGVSPVKHGKKLFHNSGRGRRGRRSEIFNSVNFFFNSSIGGFLWQGGTALGLMDRIHSEENENYDLSRAIEMLQEGELLNEIAEQKESGAFVTTPTDSSVEHSADDSEDDEASLLDTPGGPSAAKKVLSAIARRQTSRSPEKGGRGHLVGSIDENNPSTVSHSRSSRGNSEGELSLPGNDIDIDEVCSEMKDLDVDTPPHTDRNRRMGGNNSGEMTDRTNGFEGKYRLGEVSPSASSCCSGPTSPVRKFIEGFLRIDAVFYTKREAKVAFEQSLWSAVG